MRLENLRDAVTRSYGNAGRERLYLGIYVSKCGGKIWNLEPGIPATGWRYFENPEPVEGGVAILNFKRCLTIGH